MASDGRNSATVDAINAAIASADNLYSPPEEERRWKVYWARYWCFKSQKKEKRIVPAARSEGASGSAREWPTAQAGLGLAPPSSPASFVNSTVQSPASFTLSLSAASASMCSPGRPNTMFTIGPYAHETQLVSPPVFSTFTTEPSTAPFTPPPELAHLTTPSSPDVPFAQYIRSSLEAKRATRETISPLSTSTLASPCDTPVSYTPTSSHYFLGSPVGRLVSPTFGYSGEVVSYEKHPPLSSTYVGTVSSFPTYDPYASANFGGVPFAALILPTNDTNSKCEEQPSSVLVQPDSEYDNGCSLHREVGETVDCEHGDSSSHVEVGEKIVTEDSGSSWHKEAGETDVESQVELDLRHIHGTNLGSRPLKVCDNYGYVQDQDAQRIDGSCSGASTNDCIKKGEKLQELLVHERNEEMLLQHPTERECSFSAFHSHDIIKPPAKKGGMSSDGEPASDFEMCQKDSSQHSVDPLQWAETKAIMFQLDDISE